MKDNELPLNKYVPVIGLEVHAQLATRSKFFGPEAISTDALPNTQVSAITLAHPGTLPSINKQAVAYAVAMGLACRSTITQRTIFARKSYFYPDLPKGFQITQDKTPLCVGGQIQIQLGSGQEKNIALTRIHLEEDAGKSVHDMIPGKTLVDYNRAGVPLIEIVTTPTIETSEEAYGFLTAIRRLVRYLGICDGNMEEGSLRCDANVSVRHYEQEALGTKVEVKNMNSIRNVQRAIAYEIERQITLLEAKKTIISTTRSFDASRGITVEMRAKEIANDYRYFPEPDLSPLVISDEWLATLAQKLPLLPWECHTKFTTVYGLSNYDAKILVEDKDLASFFDALCQETSHYKMAANWVLGPVKSYLNEYRIPIQKFPLSISCLSKIIALIGEEKISFSSASQQLYPLLLADPMADVIKVATTENLLQENDLKSLEKLVTETLAAYPEKVASYRAGKKGLLGFFMGALMKSGESNLNPKHANQLLKEQLES